MSKGKEVAVAVSPEVMPSQYVRKPTDQIIESVVQEIEAMLVERTKHAREEVMLVMWETGRMLREAEKTHKVNISALVTRIALDNRLAGRQMGERNLWLGLKFHDTFPAFEEVYDTEHGQNVSWSKVKKMLTTPKPKKEKTIKEIAIDLVERLGIEGARTLALEITKECDKQSKYGAGK